MLDAVPPSLCDPEIERLVVAQIFHDATAITRLSDLDPEDFSDANLGAIVLACMDVHASGGRVSAVSLAPRLRGIVTLDGSDGLSLIKKFTVVENAPRIEDAVARLKELARRRKASDYLRSIADAVNDESSKLGDLVSDAARQLERMAPPPTETTSNKLDVFDIAGEFIDYLQRDEDPIEITSGYADLDKATGGWRRGQFIILAGRPSMGKSTVALSSLIRTAQAGHGVLFFSLEMQERELIARALADLSYTEPPIAYSDLRPKQPERVIARLMEAQRKLANIPLEIDATPNLSVEEINSRALAASERLEAKGKRLGLVVVDHLLKVAPSGRYAGNPVKELDEISQAMPNMAKRLGVAVMGLHQLNRDNEDRDNKRPRLDDLRGSGSIEQDADVVMFCFRPAYHFERQQGKDDADRREQEAFLSVVKYDLELQIAKQRNGPPDIVNLWCDMASNAVRNKEWRKR